MIVFNECRIDSEGKYLIVEASVENLDYFKNVYIESIVIDTQDTYSANGPSNKAVYTKEFDNTENKKVLSETDKEQIYEEGDEVLEVYCDEKDLVKNIRLRIPVADIAVNSLNDNIFFVYIQAGGDPVASDGFAPCGMDEVYTMGIAINMRPIYNMAMGYIRELESSCETPRGFIDMILRLKAFELSLKTGNYQTAFKQWDKLKNRAVIPSKKNCGCHGTY
jgi:hypothetical protein